MQITFSEEAEREISESQDWYESCAQGLGLEFVRAVEVAVGLTTQNPLAHPKLEKDYRHVILRKFPYSIIYLPFDTEIFIVSCFHHKRKPLSWLG